MPAPRIFISSTCYDLQEIRNNLRKFISDFGYESVNSEFSDIFYDFDKHIQDSCIKEIEKCQMFILIVGNNYGSVYYKNETGKEIPDSVTLKEFNRALSIEIPKFIFIEKFLDHDYLNYKKALADILKDYFNKNDLKEKEEIDKKIADLRRDFDTSYPFPQNNYYIKLL